MSRERQVESVTEREALLSHISGRLHRGGNAAAVLDELRAQGLSLSEAESLVAEVLKPMNAVYRKAGWRTLAMGLGLSGLGAALTFGSMFLAQRGGTYYVVTTGLFVVGGTYAVRGLVRGIRGAA